MSKRLLRPGKRQLNVYASGFKLEWSFFQRRGGTRIVHSLVLKLARAEHSTLAA
jgi:hypothetical protein